MLNSVQFSQLICRFASVLIAVSQSRKGKNKGNLWVNIKRRTIKKPENSSPSVPEIMKARLKPELALTEIRSQRNPCLYGFRPSFLLYHFLYTRRHRFFDQSDALFRKIITAVSWQSEIQQTAQFLLLLRRDHCSCFFHKMIVYARH